MAQTADISRIAVAVSGPATWLRRLAPAVRPLAAVVIVLLALGATMNSAAASCGDYLYRNGVPVSGHASMTADGSELAMAAESSQPSDHKPCSGPLCKSGPGAPASPLAQIKIKVSSDTAALICSASNDGAERGSRWVPQSENATCLLAYTIFRPPRCA